MLEAYRAHPFRWGEHDCALFAFNVVRDLTGVDHAAEYRGRYNTEFGAVRCLKEQADGTLRGAIQKALGEPIAPTLAQRGDVVLWSQPEFGDTVGVCIGAAAVFVGIEPAGLVRVEMAKCSAAWRI